jgi:predicted nucleic-acid-binding Zn-ribbon protein
MQRSMKCPKCGSQMNAGKELSDYNVVKLVKSSDGRVIGSDKVIPVHCENCGYIELYNENNLKKN